MNSIYGSPNQHIPRTTFKFAATYPSRRGVQEDEKKYQEYQNKKNDPNVKKEYIHEIHINDYILIDYTEKPIHKNSIVDPSLYYKINEADDADLQSGDTFQPSNYHYTVWQKQEINEKAVYIAIARLHSILPTFEQWGSYEIDVLEPLSSDPSAFGAGKVWEVPQKT